MSEGLPLMNGCDPAVAKTLVQSTRAARLRTDASPEAYISDVIGLYTQAGGGPWAAHAAATGYEAWVCAQVSRDPDAALRTVVAYSPMLVDRAFAAEHHPTRRAAFTLADLVDAVRRARSARGLPAPPTAPPTIHRDTFRYTNG